MRLVVTGGSGFIGKHLLRAAMLRGHEVLNFDIRTPVIPEHRASWCELDIMDAPRLAREVRAFAPTALIHLAARTDCVEDTTVEEGYAVNTVGTSNVLAAARGTDAIQRIVITSTQFVFNKGEILPAHDRDYAPHTVYGQSKVISEQLTRSADLPCTWIIARPTNVWGPWHERQRDAFFYALQKGLYMHPGPSVRRSYGYVGNVVHQFLQLLEAPAAAVHGRVFYMGDEPIELLDWVNAFSLRIKRRRVPVVPLPVLRALGKLGDGISRFTGKPFLITTSRLTSMTRPYLVPMQPTFDVLGPTPYSLAHGVEATATWLRDQSAW